jgi:sugar phosphate isomerase/epimerase
MKGIFGCHEVYEAGYSEALGAAARAGFSYVQFDLNVPRFYLDGLSGDTLAEIRSIAADLGLGISLHAPGDNISLFSDYPAIRRGILDHLKMILEKADILEARHLVVHPLAPPSFRRADNLEDQFQKEYSVYFKDILKANLGELSHAAGGVLLLVENQRLGSIARTALEELFAEDDRIGLSLDWAKAHSKSLVLDEAQAAFFEKHRRRIREIHLHDMDEGGRSHLRPGQGKLDFAPLFSRFFSGEEWLTVEVRPLAEAAKARELFSGLIDGKEA